ncbi:hypothetical protein [Clostridium saccharoperbutylacetonicum]|uniref:hypothetical protein n=1 Tax=Clostridium saccharoperbutylacetonicum TaxID=36745 RepID=UPI00098641C7|nr:hypothetical protein [Clostridium saccharoperbutylacetonicum]NSB34551.1 rRNA maturation endonuclease Nob1 [Clostridium saccharoperbutylacetonicum]
MKKSKEWVLGFGELKYLSFSKKVCKTCGTKMKKITTEEYMGIKKWMDDDGIKSKSENYRVRYYYQCLRCNKIYSMEELSKQKE